MIVGALNAIREPVVSVRFRDGMGVTHDVPAVIDTGFTEWLSVTPAVAALLGATAVNPSMFRLADGKPIFFPRVEVELFWWGDFAVYAVPVFGTAVLLGMKLFDAHELFIEGGPGGVVEVRSVP